MKAGRDEHELRVLELQIVWKRSLKRRCVPDLYGAARHSRERNHQTPGGYVRGAGRRIMGRALGAAVPLKGDLSRSRALGSCACE
jgi:hypothetical protein